MNFFELLHQDKNSRARTGIIHTDHGDIETPMFMPVGTQASVKSLDSQDLKNINAQIILGNTYHLHLRPGEDLIAEQGGLHKFMNWDRPILTDSGGFQVFSLGKQREARQTVILSETKDPSRSDKRDSSAMPQNDSSPQQGRLVTIDEDGVTFTSHIDGSTHRFTPESAIETQHKLGADIIMAFDECTPDDAAREYTKEAMDRTHRWAERCLGAHKRLQTPRLGGEGHQWPGVGSPTPTASNPPLPRPSGELPYRQFLFGIIQGANFKDLREESARYISSLDFDGIAIGGESIGYNMEATANILGWVQPIIPADKPHYAMGIGLSPTDLLVAIENGVDMFDCVAPTRLARHGMVFTSIPSPRGEGRGVRSWRLNLKSAAFAKDTRPIDEHCLCSTCSPIRSLGGTKEGKNYTRSYLHHLFAAEELSALRLTSIHNLYFMLNLMREAREAIKEDRFAELKKQWL